ncbi:hypothetical protein D3C75_1066800 [compost metagenome]
MDSEMDIPVSIREKLPDNHMIRRREQRQLGQHAYGQTFLDHVQRCTVAVDHILHVQVTARSLE